MLDTNNATRNSMASLMPQLLEVLNALATAGDEESLIEGLVVMIELAEHSPRLFRHVIVDVLPFMIEIVKKKELEDRTRQSALELLLTLAECAPGMVRKVPDYTTTIVPVALEMMTELEED